MKPLIGLTIFTFTTNEMAKRTFMLVETPVIVPDVPLSSPESVVLFFG
jgi:hypothetical protein